MCVCACVAAATGESLDPSPPTTTTSDAPALAGDVSAQAAVRMFSSDAVRDALSEMLQWAEPHTRLMTGQPAATGVLNPRGSPVGARNGRRTFQGQFNGTSGQLRGLAEAGNAPVSNRVSEMGTLWDDKSGALGARVCAVVRRCRAAAAALHCRCCCVPVESAVPCACPCVDTFPFPARGLAAARVVALLSPVPLSS